MLCTARLHVRYDGLVHSSSQHLKNDCGRPPEQENAIHCRHRSKELPIRGGNDVAVAKRRIIHKCEIDEVGADRYGIDNRHRIGVERILWSSDYPHGNCNYPDAWPAVLASLNGVPADERHLICAGNAQRLYGFGK